MDPQRWDESGEALHATAARQWAGLYRTLLGTGAAIETVEPEPGLPDLVFTANAAVVLDRKALLARFRHPERQCEQPVYRGRLPGAAGARPARRSHRDARGRAAGRRRRLHLGHRGAPVLDGMRLPLRCGGTPWSRSSFGVRCLPLALADPSFYHLDTAFCALPCGSVTLPSRRIHAGGARYASTAVAPPQRIALDRADAARFAANAVCIGRVIVLSSCSEALRRTPGTARLHGGARRRCRPSCAAADRPAA